MYSQEFEEKFKTYWTTLMELIPDDGLRQRLHDQVWRLITLRGIDARRNCISLDCFDIPTCHTLSHKVIEHDPRCSHVVANKAFMCDCKAVEKLWNDIMDLTNCNIKVESND